MFPYKPVCFTTLGVSIFQHKSIRFISLQYASSQYTSACFRKVEYVSMQYQYSASQYVLVEAACSVQVSTCQYVSVRVSAFQYKSVRFGVFHYNWVCLCTNTRVTGKNTQAKTEKVTMTPWHHKNKQKRSNKNTGILKGHDFYWQLAFASSQQINTNFCATYSSRFSPCLVGTFGVISNSPGPFSLQNGNVLLLLIPLHSANVGVIQWIYGYGYGDGSSISTATTTTTTKETTASYINSSQLQQNKEQLAWRPRTSFCLRKQPKWILRMSSDPLCELRYFTNHFSKEGGSFGRILQLHPPKIYISVLRCIAIGAGTATVFVVFHPQSHSITAQSLKESILRSPSHPMLESMMCHHVCHGELELLMVLLLEALPSNKNS